jgi:phosphoribosylformimino-5-aminoimidazole carboxamide ribotide isomerase
VQVIGVLDLQAGRAVHARGGARELYQPVRMVGSVPIAAGDPVALARAYVDDLGVTCLYAADLDAILNQLRVASANADRADQSDRAHQGDAAGQDAIIRQLTALGVPVWLDAGVSSPERARHTLRLGAERVVVGLETLVSFELLERICVMLGHGRVVFSLDLRHGVPISLGRGTRVGLLPEPAPVVAARAASRGISAVIVLDLARVGTGVGPDFALIASVREAAPDVMLVAGGGVRGPADLAQLADVGCDGALVATALLDGRLGATDVAAAQEVYKLTR